MNLDEKAKREKELAKKRYEKYISNPDNRAKRKQYFKEYYSKNASRYRQHSINRKVKLAIEEAIDPGAVGGG